MIMAGGIALLVTRLALVFAGRERSDGTALIPVRGWMYSVYPPVCLALIAFGIALIIAGV
jgi:hypothetical protein